MARDEYGFKALGGDAQISVEGAYNWLKQNSQLVDYPISGAPRFVDLPETVIDEVRGEVREGRVGVWVVRHEKPLAASGAPAEDKIAAIGIRLRKWVSFHGLSINVDPDLSHFSGIVPCGISEHGVTSLVDLGLPVTMHDLDLRLRETFGKVFGDQPDQPRRACATERDAEAKAAPA